ncbi:MAG: hydrogenase maturation protease [Planctomycetes bacterium]|nr:hydrogenase maturation protease [Planctomycetota bacterium]MCH9727284.1 hydrogenase maturation protease [Planctomycetota bacterium]MCH9779142.1 hydrogenase maturation protease [Planctomycetota bacterium]MCH9792308.1 hydrogenase maturation protease [Planctomycetota bacterium]MDF1745884.1 hydrogenase maturation protease [Gimesia sp.]
MTHPSQVLIAGIGSPHGDDQVGWETVKQIQNMGSDLVSTHLARTPDDLLDCMEGFRLLVICDACQGAGDVGSSHHWEWPCNQLESINWSGTHNVSLPAVLALAEQLGRLPAAVHIWGVEVEQVLPGHPMSERVLAGAASVAQAICKELSIPMKTAGTQHA